MSTIALSGDDRLPRYQRVADALRLEIIEGRWRPGDRAPSENDLAETFAIAPGTARQAIGQLVEQGLLERSQGRGTFVRRPRFDNSLFRFFRFRGPDGRRVEPESRILSRKVKAATAPVAKRLGLEKGADVILMERLRLVEGSPVVAEKIWLCAQRFERFLALPTEEIGPLLYPVYDALCQAHVAQAQEDLTVGAASAKASALLDIPRGAPVVMIDRLAKGFDDGAIEWRNSIGRADAFHYRTEIR